MLSRVTLQTSHVRKIKHFYLYKVPVVWYGNEMLSKLRSNIMTKMM